MRCQKRTDVRYGNPIIDQVEWDKRQRQHKDRLRNMKASIDCKRPREMRHLTDLGRDYFARKRATTEAAFADLKMMQNIASTMTRPLALPERPGPSSLNSSQRKRELFRITMDNHRLLERLEGLKPVYSTGKLLEESREKQKYLNNASYSKRKLEEQRRRTSKARSLMTQRHGESTPNLHSHADGPRDVPGEAQDGSREPSRRAAARQQAPMEEVAPLPPLRPSTPVKIRDEEEDDYGDDFEAVPPPAYAARPESRGQPESRVQSRQQGTPMGGLAPVTEEFPTANGEEDDYGEEFEDDD